MAGLDPKRAVTMMKTLHGLTSDTNESDLESSVIALAKLVDKTIPWALSRL